MIEENSVGSSSINDAMNTENLWDAFKLSAYNNPEDESSMSSIYTEKLNIGTQSSSSSSDCIRATRTTRKDDRKINSGFMTDYSVEAVEFFDKLLKKKGK